VIIRKYVNGSPRSTAHLNDPQTLFFVYLK
jgi:hypothetical protein